MKKSPLLESLALGIVVFGALILADTLHRGWWDLLGWIVFWACLSIRDGIRKAAT